MTLVILLFALGIVMLAVEVIVPGGILGAIGGLLMLGGCVASFSEFGTGGGVLSVVLAVLVTGAAFFIELRVLPRTAAGKRAFLNAEITGTSAALGTEAQALVGKPAEALTMLSPSGYVRIDGRRYEAFCQAGQVPAGTALKVVAADNFRLIVSPSNPT